MFENQSFVKIESSSERNFGITFAVVFIIFSFIPMWYGESIRMWTLAVACIFVFLAFFLPKILILPNKLWFKLGIFLGAIVAPIVMGIIFFLTVVPTGIIMQLVNKKKYSQKNWNIQKSFCIKIENENNSIENQF